MEDESKKINYLPEDLRKDEERELAKKMGQPQTSSPQFHIPQKISDQHNQPAISNIPDEETKEKATPLVLEETPAQENRTKKLLGKFFKFKREHPSEDQIGDQKTTEVIKEEIKPSFRPPEEKNGGLTSSKLVMRDQLAESIDVNLIPEGTYLLSNRQVLGGVIRLAFLAIVVLAIAYAALVFYSSSIKGQEKTLDDQLAQKETELKNYLNVESGAGIWQEKVQTLDGLLAKHIYWTKFFSELEALTIPEVYYLTIVANSNGTVSLAANASDYTAVARQFIVFLQAEGTFKSVEIGSLSGNPQSGSIGFNILLELQENLFYQASLK